MKKESSERFPIGMLVHMLRNTSNILVVTGYSEGNEMCYVISALDPTTKASAEFVDHLKPVTLIDLCNTRAKIDTMIRDFC